jgi:hypothetical protein
MSLPRLLSAGLRGANDSERRSNLPLNRWNYRGESYSYAEIASDYALAMTDLIHTDLRSAIRFLHFNSCREGILELIKMRDDKDLGKIMFDEIDRFH